MHQSSARLISIIFALSVTIGAWLLFEYGQRPAGKTPAQDVPQMPQLPQSAGRQQSMPRYVPPGYAATYQCKGSNGIVIRDHPCSPNERELNVTTSRIVQSPPNEIANLRAKAAAMEQERLASTARLQAAQSQQALPTQNKRAICDDIDRQVAGIDSILRQPNSPGYIDYMKAERKKLMDYRFSTGC